MSGSEVRGGASVETPHLSIDGAGVERNIEKMAAIAGRNGVALRPHVKTHEIPAIARAQVEAGAAGITVAKVSEAEVMADAELEDTSAARYTSTTRSIWPVGTAPWKRCGWRPAGRCGRRYRCSSRTVQAKGNDGPACRSCHHP